MLSSSAPQGSALWPLPLLAGLLPAIAAIAALVLYTQMQETWCNPFVKDCVSISRMARHGLANLVFRALVLPAAVLQALTWLLAARLLANAGLSRRTALLLACLGLFAGVMLVTYTSFLGTDGEVYRWLRRWGTLGFFGSSYLSMLIFASAARKLQRAHVLSLPQGSLFLMAILLVFVTTLSLVHLAVAAAPMAAWENRIENLTEWWGSLAMTLGFVTMAAIWRHWDARASLSMRTLGGSADAYTGFSAPSQVRR